MIIQYTERNFSKVKTIAKNLFNKTRITAGITATALCLALAACGGGSDSTDTSTAVDPSSVVDVQRHPASVNGTKIPPATSISDSSGAVWTVKKGFIYRAGKKTISSDVILVLWYEGVIYQEDDSLLWWKWQNNGWVACTDPRPAVTPPVVTPPVVIPPVVTPPVVTPPVVTPPVVTPPVVTPPVTAPAYPFFGIGGHYIQGGLSQTVPLATQAATMADLGTKVIREDMYDNGGIDVIASKVVTGLGANVQVLPCIIAYPYSDPSLNGNTPTEASAYAYAYAIAAHAATKFAGIPMVEFGNEYDIDSHNRQISNDGQNVTDYDNNTWPIWRGSLRGSVDGWRSVDTAHTTKIIATASSGWIYLGWFDGMLNGKQPDGTSGHPKVVTDIIQYHFYQDGGDFETAIGHQGTYNVLALLKEKFNLPVYFSEIGSSPDQSTASQVAYVTKTVAELVAAKTTYNVIGFNWYEMYSYPNDSFGVLTSATAKTPTYAPLKAAIAKAGTQ